MIANDIKEVIRAILNHEKIQYRRKGGDMWLDLDLNRGSQLSEYHNYEFRIKPETANDPK